MEILGIRFRFFFDFYINREVIETVVRSEKAFGKTNWKYTHVLWFSPAIGRTMAYRRCWKAGLSSHCSAPPSTTWSPPKTPRFGVSRRESRRKEVALTAPETNSTCSLAVKGNQKSASDTNFEISCFGTTKLWGIAGWSMRMRTELHTLEVIYGLRIYQLWISSERIRCLSPEQKLSIIMSADAENSKQS